MSNPNNVTYKIPDRVTQLGEVLFPIAKYLHNALTQRVPSAGREFETIQDLLHHSGVIQRTLAYLEIRVEDISRDVLSNEKAGLAEANRVAGRLEQVLAEFVDGYHDAQSTLVGSDPYGARELLLAVYRHYIREISDWLDKLIEAIANPASAIESRGIVPTSEVALIVTLTMTTPQEMEELLLLSKKLQSQP
jgi:hypothetical protein